MLCIYLGISDLINEHPELAQGSVYSDPTAHVCRKNTGKSKSLRKWSRGHQFIVRGGGHIDTWQPLYRYTEYTLELQALLYGTMYNRVSGGRDTMYNRVSFRGWSGLSCTALLVLVNTGSGCLVNTSVVMPLIMAPPV